MRLAHMLCKPNFGVLMPPPLAIVARTRPLLPPGFFLLEFPLELLLPLGRQLLQRLPQLGHLALELGAILLRRRLLRFDRPLFHCPSFHAAHNWATYWNLHSVPRRVL